MDGASWEQQARGQLDYGGIRAKREEATITSIKLRQRGLNAGHINAVRTKASGMATGHSYKHIRGSFSVHHLVPAPAEQTPGLSHVPSPVLYFVPPPQQKRRSLGMRS